MQIGLKVLAFALTSLFALEAGTPADSKKAAKDTAPAAKRDADCRGVDMLGELKIKDPEAFAKIQRESEATENTGAILWRIEKPDLAPSHLFGTVHLTDERTSTLSPKVKEALGAANTVVLEVADISAEATMSAISDATKLAVFTDGRSLMSMLTPEEYAKVEATLGRSGLPPAAGRLFKPWIVSMLLSGSDCERRKVQSGELVLDMKIAADAKARGVPVLGLETIQSQLAVMANVPEDQQLDMLRASLAYAERTDDLVETMVQLYLQRRMGVTWPFQIALATKAGVPETAFVAFRQSLIIDRNAKMRDGALPILDKGGAFIAVGALHLSGKDGLVEFIRQAGYTVTGVE